MRLVRPGLRQFFPSRFFKLPWFWYYKPLTTVHHRVHKITILASVLDFVGVVKSRLPWVLDWLEARRRPTGDTAGDTNTPDSMFMHTHPHVSHFQREHDPNVVNSHVAISNVEVSRPVPKTIDWLNELRFYVELNTIYIILEMFINKQGDQTFGCDTAFCQISLNTCL